MKRFCRLGVENLPDRFDYFLGFIVWNLGKSPKRANSASPFVLVLGLGVFGFGKELLIKFLVLPNRLPPVKMLSEIIKSNLHPKSLI